VLVKERDVGKTKKKTYAATGWPQGKVRVLEIERESTRWHCVENSLWKRLLVCRKAMEL
jgi:hypothetical protein